MRNIQKPKCKKTFVDSDAKSQIVYTIENVDREERSLIQSHTNFSPTFNTVLGMHGSIPGTEASAQKESYSVEM